MNRFVSILLPGLLAFLHTPIGAQQWVDVTPAVNTALIQGMNFVSDKTGYVVGDSNMLLQTNNGGLTWQSVQVPVCTDCITNYYAAKFFTPERGIIWGVNKKSSAQVVLRTSDGGSTWVEGDTSLGTLNYIAEDFGYRSITNPTGITSVENLVWVSHDLGKTFETRYQKEYQILEGGYTQMIVKFADTLNGVIWEKLTADPQMPLAATITMHYTTNGGKSWASSDRIPYSFEPMADHTWIGRDGADLLHSADGGKTWTTVSTLTFNPLRLFPATGLDVYASQYLSTEIAHSSDGGKTWSFEQVDEYPFYAVTLESFRNATVTTTYLLAATDNFEKGRIFKRTGVAVVHDDESDRSALSFQIHAGTVLLNGSEGPHLQPEIYDVLGRCRITQSSKISTHEWQMNVSALEPGAYFLRLGDQRLKFIIR